MMLWIPQPALDDSSSAEGLDAQEPPLSTHHVHVAVAVSTAADAAAVAE